MKYTFFKKYLLIFLLLSVNFCFAQGSKKSYEFIGTLQINETVIITYKINFTEIENGKIKGFSYTDFLGENKTKSEISGTIDYKNNLISFYETKNVNTISEANSTDFCYVHVKNATIKIGKTKSIIKGKFQGKYTNGSTCVDGYIYLLGSKDILNKFKKIAKKDTSLNKKIDISELKNKTAYNYLKSNDTYKTLWKNDTIIIDVWDAEKLDHDIITIKVNNKIVIKNHEITAIKKRLKIPILNDQCKIEIIGIDEGTIAPNTTNIELIDGTKISKLISYLQVGQKVNLIFNKQ